MNQYYKASIRTSYEDKKGNLKYRKENYIVFAVSPTDVEAKIRKYLSMADYELVGVNIVNIVDIVK